MSDIKTLTVFDDTEELQETFLCDEDSPLKFSLVDVDSNGMMVLSNENDKKGIFMPDFHEKIKPQYSYLTNLNNGLAVFSLTDDPDDYFKGVIDENENVVIPMEYDDIKIDSDGVIWGRKKGVKGHYVNRNGEDEETPWFIFEKKNGKYETVFRGLSAYGPSDFKNLSMRVSEEMDDVNGICVRNVHISKITDNGERLITIPGHLMPPVFQNSDEPYFLIGETKGVFILSSHDGTDLFGIDDNGRLVFSNHSIKSAQYSKDIAFSTGCPWTFDGKNLFCNGYAMDGTFKTTFLEGFWKISLSDSLHQIELLGNGFFKLKGKIHHCRLGRAALEEYFKKGNSCVSNWMSFGRALKEEGDSFVLDGKMFKKSVLKLR